MDSFLGTSALCERALGCVAHFRTRPLLTRFKRRRMEQIFAALRSLVLEETPRFSQTRQESSPLGYRMSNQSEKFPQISFIDYR